MSTSVLPEQLEFTVGVDDPAADPESPLHRDALAREVARRLRRPEAELPQHTLKKRAIDARRGRVTFHLTVQLGAEQDGDLPPAPKPCTGPARVVVVGSGPAGLFCAHELTARGIACVVLERGKPVQPRRRDLKLLNARGGVNPESNYCFGEGGAGTYSDGKLYTRSHKRGPVRHVMDLLARYGAPSRILVDARPHIGSNLLPQVVSKMREDLEACGVQFRFGACLTDVRVVGQGSSRKVDGVSYVDRETNAVVELEADAVVLATGHSARDVFLLAERLGLVMEPKGFALGVRVEHPQSLIDRIQYGRFAGHPKLGAAPYKIATPVDGHGVYSFCMCPGGWIVPAMTDVDHLVVNGMSLSRRDSAFANSGFVVGVEPKDYQAAGFFGALGGVQFQAHVERVACIAGGGQNRAPASRISDFIAGKVSQSLPETSYLPGIVAAHLDEVLDSTKVPIVEKMKAALRYFGERMHGYDSEEGIMVGVETRTSAPVRIHRDATTLMAEGVRGIYLAGEGPGYAGGIVSAAVDGMRVAESISETQISRFRN